MNTSIYPQAVRWWVPKAACRLTACEGNRVDGVANHADIQAQSLISAAGLIGHAPWRRYLTWTLIGADYPVAAAASSSAIFGETLLWLHRIAQLEPAKLAIRKTTRKLAEQSLDEEDLATRGKEAQGQAADRARLTVYLVPASRLSPPKGHVVATQASGGKKGQACTQAQAETPRRSPSSRTKAEVANNPVPEASGRGSRNLCQRPSQPKPKAAETPAADTPARRKGTYQPGEARKGFPAQASVRYENADDGVLMAERGRSGMGNADKITSIGSKLRRQLRWASGTLRYDQRGDADYACRA